MKNRCVFFYAVVTALAALGGCDTGGGEDLFLLDLPPLPPSWTELLGAPRWLVKYYDGGGGEVFLDLEGGEVEISLPASRPSPVFAWPYWPLRQLKPGDFRPAGAILPYDAPPTGEGRVALSWQGGVEAWFFDALNRAALDRAAPDVDADGSTASGDSAGDLRRGGQFDWMAFRALFSDPSVSGEFRSDPWLADWDAIAEKTVRSGFRKQWLAVAETLPLAVPAGPWVSPSPFAPPETGTVRVRNGTTVQAWYSAAGILHCAGAGWILLPWG
ncbi:MAG: hypothetical protein LBO76_01870 [Treponema sp.]|jgi:hypothetical protein|nr:hypothetical protein [Treponema sp.]